MLSVLLNIIFFLLIFLVLVVGYFRWTYQYWKKKNVFYLKPQIPFGNLSDVLTGKEHITIGVKKLYNEMKSRGWKHGGFFMYDKPNYLITDLDHVRNILTKDFQFFADRDFYVNEKEPIQAHLVSLRGSRWKNMRMKLTPTFSSGKMKMMFHLITECQKDLEKRMEKESKMKEPINIKEVSACFTTNVIGSCIFGLECKALEDENSEFRKCGRRMFNVSKYESLKQLFATIYPRFASFFRVSIQKKDVASFIIRMVKAAMEYREKNNYTRNDFLQMMINLKNLTFDEVASQCSAFFGAGFETSSSLMAFALYELAKNQDVQDKLREEVKKVLAEYGNMTYEALQDMKYLSQVIDETLRKHPPLGLTNRKCVKDYKVPGEDVVVSQGTTVMVSIFGIHHDEEYYPDPEKFDPERFSEEKKKLRHHYAFLPFGEGPRHCIGTRFGLLQAKVGLVSILGNYKLTVNKKTMEPIQYNKTGFILAVENEIWLDAQKI